jgi:CubicO group peptidase (beta-lactamase class C family)
LIERSLERFVQEQMIESGIPGLSLVLLRGEEVSSRHFGFAELVRRRAPSGSTRYGLGSVTKVFTALAVLQLVQEGALGLDDRAADHVGDLAASFGDATVRHLLAHASGVPALGWSETKMSAAWFMDGYPVGGYEDLATFLDGAEAWRTAPPGERWQYSNEGYILLGRLIERLDGRPFEEALHRRVLGPLGMARTTFDPDVVAADDDRVQPYLHDQGGRLTPGANLHGAMPAAGGLLSTADDMAALARLLMARGSLPDGRALVRRDLVEAMAHADVAVDPPTPFDTVSLWDDPPRVNGAGLQRHVGVLGHDVWAHGGGVMGGTTYVAAMPDAGLGVVVLANAHGYPLAQLALVALASLLGEPPEAFAFVRRQRLLKRLAGAYASYAGTIRADLRARGWGLELRFAFEPAPREVPLVLLEHDDARDVTRFLTLGSGRPGLAEIVPHEGTTGEGGRARGGYELRYERYALRRRGEGVR